MFADVFLSETSFRQRYGSDCWSTRDWTWWLSSTSCPKLSMTLPPSLLTWTPTQWVHVCSASQQFSVVFVVHCCKSLLSIHAAKYFAFAEHTTIVHSEWSLQRRSVRFFFFFVNMIKMWFSSTARASLLILLIICVCFSVAVDGKSRDSTMAFSRVFITVPAGNSGYVLWDPNAMYFLPVVPHIFPVEMLLLYSAVVAHQENELDIT